MPHAAGVVDTELEGTFMTDQVSLEPEPSDGVSKGVAVGRVNLKHAPASHHEPGHWGPDHRITGRDVLLGLLAIAIIVLGLFVILQAAYQITPT